MELFSFLLFLAVLIGVLYFLDRLIRKWFAIDQEVLESAPAKKVKNWSKGTMIVALLILYPMMLQGGDAYIFWLIVCLTAITAVEAYFEWKLLRGSRKYRMTLVSYALAMITVLVMLSIW
jgi:Na+-transporting methylmalonyl-CoA/oxaloacetate decarboxylase gamma subunit